VLARASGSLTVISVSILLGSIRTSINDCVRIMYTSIRIIVSCRIGIRLSMNLRIHINIGISISVGGIANTGARNIINDKIMMIIQISGSICEGFELSDLFAFVKMPQSSLIVTAPVPQTQVRHSSAGVHYMHTPSGHAEQLLSTR